MGGYSGLCVCTLMYVRAPACLVPTPLYCIHPYVITSTEAAREHAACKGDCTRLNTYEFQC